MQEDKQFVCACTLSTFGLDNEEFERLCGGLRTHDIDIQFREDNLAGKIFVSKGTVDDVALESVLSKMNALLDEYIYADSDIDLNRALINKLIKEGERVAVAESITGGMLSSELCGVNNASKVFYEGIVTYNSGSKVRRLHVPATIIQEHTAVSRETCEAMLKGVLANKEVQYGITTTGYATHEDKALQGKAFIGFGTSENPNVVEVKYTGSRNEIRAKVVNCAMYCLLKYIEKNKRNY